MLRRLTSLIRLQMGFGFIAGGIFMVTQGIAARKEIKDSLEAEKVVTHPEASLPSQPVHDFATAQSQAELVRDHTLRRTEGRTFSEIPREDPMHQIYINSIAIRTSLSMAAMGFRISDLVVGMGVFMASVGGAMIVLTPSLRSNRDTAKE